MESTDNFSRSDFVYRDEALVAFHSLLCAMGRFYADDRGWLDRSVSRERLIARIACSLSPELDIVGFRPRYVLDLIQIGGLLNLGVCSRAGGANLLALSVFPLGAPQVKGLRPLCSPGPDRYRLGVSLGLGRQSYRAKWFSAEEELDRETGWHHSRWAGVIPFLHVPGTPPFIPSCTEPVSGAASAG